MPTLSTEGPTLRYKLSGESGRPTVAFVPELGFGPWMWSWQEPALSGRYRTLVYATRGTNGSGRNGPYTLDRFVADLEAILSDAGIRRVHLVGAGLGAVVALRYVREHGRARSLSLFGAAKSGGEIDAERLSELHPSNPELFRASLSVAFTDRFLSETRLVDQIVEWRRGEDATGESLSGHLRAMLDFEAEPLYELSVPTAVYHGADDPVVPVEAGQKLASELPRGRFEPVEGKRCCYIEHATAVTDAIDGFIERVEAGE